MLSRDLILRHSVTFVRCTLVLLFELASLCSRYVLLFSMSIQTLVLLLRSRGDEVTVLL